MKTPPPPPKTVTREQVEATYFFQSLNRTVQILAKRTQNIQTIQHGFTVASNIGFEKWNQITGDRYYNRMIVKELIENQE